MMVYFDTRVFSGSESSGIITISLKLRRHPSITSGEITVIIIPSLQSPVSAEGKRYESIRSSYDGYGLPGNGVDYNSTSITVTFPAGTNSTTFNVPVINDNIVERNETFQLEISIPVPVKYAVEVGYPSKAIAVITDVSSK